MKKFIFILCFFICSQLFAETRFFMKDSTSTIVKEIYSAENEVDVNHFIGAASFKNRSSSYKKNDKEYASKFLKIKNIIGSTKYVIEVCVIGKNGSLAYIIVYDEDGTVWYVLT